MLLFTKQHGEATLLDLLIEMGGSMDAKKVLATSPEHSPGEWDRMQRCLATEGAVHRLLTAP